MKRELFQNITAIPYTSGDAIDKTGFGANIAAGAKMTVKVEHSDDGETFEPVTDPRVFPEQSTKDGEYTFENPADAGAEDAEGELDTGGVVNVDVDLVGLKNIVKFTVTGNDGGLVVVLGDNSVQPV